MGLLPNSKHLVLKLLPLDILARQLAHSKYAVL